MSAQKSKKKTPYVYLATGPFGAELLETLASDFGLAPSQVVTAGAFSKDRGEKAQEPPIFKLRKKIDLDILEIDNLAQDSLRPKLDPAGRSLIILSDFGRIVPSWLLKLPRYRVLNLHPSLLPRWRGATPIQHAILAGDKKTGVTLFVMDQKIDHGPIVAQAEIKLDNRATTLSLRSHLARLGAKLIADTLPDWLAGRIKPQAQNELLVSVALRFSKKDGAVNWLDSAGMIDRLVRSLWPWPGVYSYYRKADGTKKRVLLRRVTVLKKTSHNTKKPAGTLFLSDKRQLVAVTGRGWLVLDELQPEGKKIMSGEEFWNGLRGPKRLLSPSF